MKKETIGYKVELNLVLVVLMFLAGIALIAGAVFLFLFVMGGAIGGGIAGAAVFSGATLITIGIASKKLPKGLVQIDEQNLYLNKRVINLDQIQNLFNLMGMNNVAQIFRNMTERKKMNYYPEIWNYFNLYFNKYAP